MKCDHSRTIYFTCPICGTWIGEGQRRRRSTHRGLTHLSDRDTGIYQYRGEYQDGPSHVIDIAFFQSWLISTSC